MSVITIKPPKDRQPGPYPARRPCADCGAILSRYNPAEKCAPCLGGDWPGSQLSSTEQRAA